ncbi:MAG: PepSY domain-containing protein, partial [Verrucomicrobiales bacterium]|nr:PepSY domain-containing protein [Verrucomicrobiales bacterium]
APGGEKPAPQTGKTGPAFTTLNGFAAAAVTPGQALTLAREALGEVPLERIELKSEYGQLVYKIKAARGDELWINAATGTHHVKGRYEKVKQAADGTVVARTTDWGKILFDLHTGKIGGEIGKAVMTAASVLLLLLSVSGIYMWLKPLLIRRANARAKNRAAGPSAAPTAAISVAAPQTPTA